MSVKQMFHSPIHHVEFFEKSVEINVVPRDITNLIDIGLLFNTESDQFSDNFQFLLQDWECGICQEGLQEDKEIIQLNCGQVVGKSKENPDGIKNPHIFHQRCISTWIELKNETFCPTCRGKLTN